LLVWIYVAWVIVLLGAVVTAYLPSLLAGVARRGTVAGWGFQLAVEVLQELHRARQLPSKGLRAAQLAELLRVDALQLEPVLETLTSLDWIAQVSDAVAGPSDAPELRYVLLADPERTALEPLVQRLLLDQTVRLAPLWDAAGFARLRLQDLLLNK
jgi:membrane protein